MNLVNLVVLALALTLVGVVEANSNLEVLPNDPATILDTLFGKIELEQPLEPDETSELLKRLVEEHRDAIPADKLEHVEYLYSVSRLDEAKCNYGWFERLDKALVAHGEFKTTILPYLKHFKELLWENVCRLALQNQVAEAVSKYDKDYLYDLHLLTKINMDDVDGLWGGFTENVATFIHYKLDDDKKVDMRELRNKEKFLKIYKDLVVGACERPMHDLEPMMRVYDLLFAKRDGELDSKMAKRIADRLIKGVDDGPTMWWISTIRICRVLVENDAQLISRDAQDILTVSEPMGQKIKSFFGGMFKPKN